MNDVNLHHTLHKRCVRVCRLCGSSTVKPSLDKEWTGRLTGQDKVGLERFLTDLPLEDWIICQQVWWATARQRAA